MNVKCQDLTPFAAVAAFVYLLDIASKMLVRARLLLGAEVEVLPFFSLVHVQNTGIAFGLFQGANALFIAVGLAVAVVILVLGLRWYKEDRISGLVLAAVAGGALGNLTDRIVHGRVTDFLDFYLGTHHWPAFNVADSTICIGAGLLLWRSLVTSSRRKPGSSS